jgi:hypothetical protein
MSKHTPKPWCLYGEYGGEHEIVSVSGGERSYVARAMDQDDARLIAAAPDLIEALKMCVAQLRADEPDYGKEADAIHAALLAIAQAEGSKS